MTPLLPALVVAAAVFALAYRLLYVFGRGRAQTGGARLFAAGRRSRLAEAALRVAASRTGVRTTIRVIPDWEVQALTVATVEGDRLLVSAGALTTLTPRELAALLAHEQGHVARRHLDHELRDRAARTAAPLVALALLPAGLPAALGAALLIAVAGELLLALELRRHETEADTFARAAGFGRPLARALVRADGRDRQLAELPLLMARAQRHRRPGARRAAAAILRRWEGGAPDPVRLEGWLRGLRTLAGPVRLPLMRRGTGWREIHDPVVVRARRLLTGR